MNKKEIGKYIKELREKNNLTQEKLSDFFSENFEKDISIHAISEWENGNTLPSIENLEILEDIYDKTIDELLDGADNSNDSFRKK